MVCLIPVWFRVRAIDLNDPFLSPLSRPPENCSLVSAEFKTWQLTVELSCCFTLSLSLFATGEQDEFHFQTVNLCFDIQVMTIGISSLFRTFPPALTLLRHWWLLIARHVVLYQKCWLMLICYGEINTSRAQKADVWDFFLSLVDR